MPVTGEWIATLDGYVNAQIRPQVSGYLIRRAYQEGAFVKKGEVLFEIDRAAVRSGARPGAGAARRGRGAARARPSATSQRDTPLAEQRAIAQSQLDNDIQAHDAAQAARRRRAKAAVETAQLNLELHARSRRSIDGVAAIATAQIGDLVGPTTLLTTVSQVDPIKAYFPLSEQEYLQHRRLRSTPDATTARCGRRAAA